MWGVDIHPLVIKRARRMFAEKPRVHILRANSKSNDVKHLGLSEKSMDIIIDDGVRAQHDFFFARLSSAE